MEVNTEDPDQPLGRIAADQSEGIFFVRGPEIPQAREVVSVTEPARRPGLGGLEATDEPITYSFDLGNAGAEGVN